MVLCPHPARVFQRANTNTAPPALTVKSEPQEVIFPSSLFVCVIFLDTYLLFPAYPHTAQQNPKESKKSKNVTSDAHNSSKGGKSLTDSSEERTFNHPPYLFGLSFYNFFFFFLITTEPSLDDEIWEEDEDDMDPELKAQQDREVEEFRMRLEQINNSVCSRYLLSCCYAHNKLEQTSRARIPLPSTLSIALIDTLKG